MSDSEEIKPCPFCGARVVIQVMTYANTGGVYAFTIRCNCGAEMKNAVGWWSVPYGRTPDDAHALRVDQTRKELLTAWNARHVPPTDTITKEDNHEYRIQRNA